VGEGVDVDEDMDTGTDSGNNEAIVQTIRYQL
jgi:hypothetical protein